MAHRAVYKLTVIKITSSYFCALTISMKHKYSTKYKYDIYVYSIK